MISQTLEYALRAVVTIAQHHPAPCTSQQIASITQVPGPYLSKLLQGLVRARLIASKRGLHGGFVLAQTADTMTIWDIVQAVEPLQRIEQCPLGIRSHQGTLCPLHRRLDEALAMVENTFRQTKLTQLLADKSSVTPLCESPTSSSVVPLSGASADTHKKRVAATNKKRPVKKRKKMAAKAKKR